MLSEQAPSRGPIGGPGPVRGAGLVGGMFGPLDPPPPRAGGCRPLAPPATSPNLVKPY